MKNQYLECKTTSQDPNPRIEEFLKFASASARLRDCGSFIGLLGQRAHLLIEFERLSIVLCDDDRRILRTIAIEDRSSRDVSSGEIQLSDMDVILEVLVSGSASTGVLGICVPMRSAGRMNGVLCLAAGRDVYTDHDVKAVHFLADYLAATFERLADDCSANQPLPGVSTVAEAREGTTPRTPDVLRQISYLAQHDVLTTLPNRWLLNERLARALSMAGRYQRRLAVLFLDLDRFKEINDSLGHAMGDKVLRQISDRLVACVRSSDTVSRFGGDEFVILLSELESEQDAAICARKIVNSVAAQLNIGGHELRLTLSIGIGIYPGDGEDAETLLNSADTAMYRAKAAGRGKCFFSNKAMNVIARRWPRLAESRSQVVQPQAAARLKPEGYWLSNAK